MEYRWRFLRNNFCDDNLQLFIIHAENYEYDRKYNREYKREINVFRHIFKLSPIFSTMVCTVFWILQNKL